MPLYLVRRRRGNRRENMAACVCACACDMLALLGESIEAEGSRMVKTTKRGVTLGKVKSPNTADFLSLLSGRLIATWNDWRGVVGSL